MLSSGENELRVAYDDKAFVMQTHGGISRYYAGMLPLLEGVGIHPHVFAPVHVNSHLASLPRSMVTGIHVPEFRGRRRISGLVNAPMARAAMRRFNPQIVHETYYGMVTEAPRGARLVTMVHDMIHELFADQLRDPATCRSKAASIARADLIFCNSQSTKADLLRMFPEVEDKTRVTYLAFDPDFGTGAVWRVPLRKPYLIYVGMRRFYKNFSALLAAYANSSHLRENFDLVCIGGGEFDTDERESIARNRLDGKVHQFSATDRQLRSWYSNAAAFVYPSIYEGFGIPPLEAMAANCPVVAVKASCVPEICGDGAEFASDGSPDALSQAIEAVVFDSERADWLREAGRERVAHFSWQKTAQVSADCYRELA